MFSTAQRPARHAVARPARTLAHSSPKATTAPTSTSRKQKCIERARTLYEDVWSEGKIRLLNDIMSEDHVQRDVIWQPENTGGGRDRLKRGVLAFRKAYPDLKFTVTDVAACEGGDRVFVSWDASGTNLGPIHTQEPTGRRVTFSGITRVLFDSEGRIQESQVYRQAPSDEASFFIGQRSQHGVPAAGAGGGSSSSTTSRSSGSGGAPTAATSE